MALDDTALRALRANDIQLLPPRDFRGKLERTGLGEWKLETPRRSPDACIIAYPPLYAVRQRPPLTATWKRTVYYEVHLRSVESKDAAVAVGFTALPYPGFRMPGWHRGSMAVHGDDGHKFVNDQWGGVSFTQPFQPGGAYGIGMTFEASGGRISVTCFFTRDGRVSETWDLHEEQDAQETLPVTGLEGFHDLSCAVGTYGQLKCEVVFDPAKWRHQPEHVGIET